MILCGAINKLITDRFQETSSLGQRDTCVELLSTTFGYGGIIAQVIMEIINLDDPRSLRLTIGNITEHETNC